MNLTAISFGSRGDIEPFVTLGGALVRAGHHVRLLTHPEYAPLAADTGIELLGARGRSTRELMESDEGREALRHVRNPIAALRRIRDVVAPELQLIYEDCVRAADGADGLLAFPATFPALDVADHLRRPVVHVHHVPMVPTRSFPAPAPYIKVRTLTRLGNRASYPLDALLLWQLMRGATERARRRVLGSTAAAYGVRQALAQRRRRAGAIIGVSPQVVRPPRDWPPDAVMCGYWWPPGDGRDRHAPVAADTRRFLAAGPPPVFLGLGSTPVADPAALTRQVTEAAARAQVRLVLQRGWAGLGHGVEDPGIHIVDDIAYDAVFPHVRAVVHHGGAGTVALGLRHGRPTLCLPAVADQFFWSHRVAEIGVGPAPLPVGRLDPQRLARGLEAVSTEQRYAGEAARVAACLRAEHGSEVAVAAVERFLG